MKAESFRGLDVKELERRANDMREQMFRLRFQVSMGQPDGLKKYRALKKDRARVLGVLRERQGGAGTAGEGK